MSDINTKVVDVPKTGPEPYNIEIPRISLKDFVVFGCIALLTLDMVLGWGHKKKPVDNQNIAVAQVDVILGDLRQVLTVKGQSREIVDLKVALAAGYIDVIFDQVLHSGRANIILDSTDVLAGDVIQSGAIDVTEEVSSRLLDYIGSDKKIQQLGGTSL